MPCADHPPIRLPIMRRFLTGKSMRTLERITSRPLLLLIAGAKGAIGSTLALASLTMQRAPESISPYLTTRDLWAGDHRATGVYVAGWDVKTEPMSAVVNRQRVVPDTLWRGMQEALDTVQVTPAPNGGLSLPAQVEQLMNDIAAYRKAYPEARPVLVNLLPACRECDLSPGDSQKEGGRFPDMAYARAALKARIPFINFTPNDLGEALQAEAADNKVPFLGRDGKTGQTYFKVVLASALKARRLKVDGWYSLNILGNADGRNLMDPDCARGKLANKTELLDDVLGYRVGEAYGESAHKVRIDYYPPRGDAKEAWDVIDIQGIFGLPMSIRINLQGRDSILAAPLVLDLARWAVLLQAVERGGPIPELGFFFKKPEGAHPSTTYEDQLHDLKRLETQCRQALSP
jgi:myo-inositol-1-phosphate synthase